MKNPVFVSLLLLLFAVNLSAQDKMSWRKHAKLAEELYNKGQFADAGEHYRAAWKKKTKKKEFIYKAGESFFFVRDYRNAADAWQHVKDEGETYPLIGLRYARCLKQNGDYEAASSELVNFLSNYQGADKANISKIVQNELRGCELAAQMAVQGEDESITISHLGSNINTPETEFAPFPYGDEALYYSSTMGKRAEIYRSIKTGDTWSRSTPIDNFPVIENDHFCNGSLAPDASRFYFTICQSVESWGGLTSRCEIYVTRRVGKTWTAPERLPEYVNEVNMTTTHPYVVHDNGTEILYFASNRQGGVGGMDIWYTTREISSNANDFTLPINAGTKVNTIGDEITPFYDPVEDMLYFASNGQISIGGYDIFSAKGERSRWEMAENVGTPVNSPADDFFFVKKTSGEGGFFASNRTFEMEKVTTTDEDIFAFQYNEPVQRWFAAGEVFSKMDRAVLNDIEIALYEIADNDQRRFLDKVVSKDGKYNFPVEPSKRYRIEVLKDGYFPSTYDFDTRDFAEYDDFGAPLFLEPYYETREEEEAVVADNRPMKKVPVKDEQVTVPPVKEEIVMAEPEESRKAVVNPEVGKNGKTESGTGEDSIATPEAGVPYFKIQIIALGDFNENHSRYNPVRKMGTLDTEFFSEKNLYRVMIADYYTFSEAKADLAKVRKMRDFKDAFIVEYKNGERVKAHYGVH